MESVGRRKSVGRRSSRSSGRVSGTSRRSGRRTRSCTRSFSSRACRCGRPDAARGGFRIGGFPADDVHVRTAAIKAYGECGALDKAEELYARMTTEGGAVARPRTSRASPCSRRTKSASGGKARWRFCRGSTRADAEAAAEKDRTGVDPRDPRASGWNSGAVDAEELHFNIAMSACEKCGEWREADRLFREMLARA